MRRISQLFPLLATLLVPASPARSAADPLHPAPVNLLTAMPTVVAVSSTVANRAIAPAHLIDGDLATAWNSRTGELEGAWIGARISPAAQVTAIRLTAGFTAVDRKLGDLFTMNPRIRKVRVLRNGKPIAEQALDPELRVLQDIAIDQRGGEFRVEVVEIVPGTKRAWREISVSEFEVRGTLPPGTTAKLTWPIVRVGSFDPPPATDCAKALFPNGAHDRIASDPDAEAITGTAVVEISDNLMVCQVDHSTGTTVVPPSDIPLSNPSEVEHTTTTVELAPVTRRRPVRAGDRITETITSDVARDPTTHSDRGSVAIAPFPLTTTEQALLVHVTSRGEGPMEDSGETKSTLYRVSARGLTALLTFESTWSTGESENSDRCQLRPPAKLLATPQPIALECEHAEGRWHGEDPRGNGRFTTPTTVRYRWTGARYDPR